MTLAGQAAVRGHDGQVTSGKPGKLERRTFTAYKAGIPAESGALPRNSTGRGAPPGERLCHSRIEGRRRQGGRPATRDARPGMDQQTTPLTTERARGLMSA
jgi:hypothetical protein